MISYKLELPSDLMIVTLKLRAPMAKKHKRTNLKQIKVTSLKKKSQLKSEVHFNYM